ncbi:hypothetical protein V2O64_06065 [Verrucomicrobiaceae bacterium 227]
MNYHRAIITIGLTCHLSSAEIDWNVTAAGGVDSSGGPYSMRDTLGEALAGVAALNSEAYGFWAFLLPLPATPGILIKPLAKNQIEVSWTPAATGWVLLLSSDLQKWTELSSTSPWTGPRKNRAFFRLQSLKSK